MLYTVRPLERVYAQPEVFDRRRDNKPKAVAKNEGEYREVLLPNGRLVTRRQGEAYIIERINSTDMQDYLNEDYIPGQSYKDNG